jgi:16S rRNA (adenine1518-N6/adenine1519-N6)-dimethyltransferase
MQHAVKAKKHLGQHFLKDLGIAKKIAYLVPKSNVNQVLEIGPGTGVLTQFLLQQKNLDTHVIELDSESVIYLKEHFPKLEGKIHYGDFLEFPLERIFGDNPFHIVGNFPYNISSQILFRVLEEKHRIPSVVCMLQKEVAMRLAAGPGTKDYGILSVLLQAFYDIKYEFTVDASVFSPPPKVQSGVISLSRNDVLELPVSEKLFTAVVKAAFNQRRKMLRNSLASINNVTEATLGKFATLRPEQISVNDFIEISQMISTIAPTVSE